MGLINDVLNRYIQAIDQGFGFINHDVAWLLNALIILNITLSALVWAFSDDQVIVQFCRKVIYLGFFVWMIQNWKNLTDLLARSFMVIAFKAGGIGFPQDYVMNPGNIAGRGLTTIDPLMRAIHDLTGPVNFFKNFPEIALLSLAIVAVLIAFFVIAIQCAVAILSFKLGSLAAFVLVPFGVLNKTVFIAERPLGWVVMSGVKLMVLTLVAGIGDGMFSQMRLTANQVSVRTALDVALAAVVLMILAIVGTRLAGDLISGGPTLGAGAAAAAVGGSTVAAYGAGQTVVAAGRGVYAGGSRAVNAVRSAAMAMKSGGTSLAASVATNTAKGAIGAGAQGAGSGTSGSLSGAGAAQRVAQARPAQQGSAGAGGIARLRDGARRLGEAGGASGGGTGANLGQGGGDAET
jgi:type IV secretion system protein TrbL